MWYEPSTGKTFSSIHSIRVGRQDVSLPESPSEDELRSIGIFTLVDAQIPAYDKCSQTIESLEPTLSGGSYERRWAVVGMGAAEAASTLDNFKAMKNAEINAARLSANRSTFTHQGKAFACDELSRSDIDGVTSYVSLSGSMPPGWPGAWKAVDNTYHPITSVDDWKAFVASMVAAGNANFAKAQALKGRLASATTSDQIEAIRW